MAVKPAIGLPLLPPILIVAVFRSLIWGTKSAQCTLNVHGSNSFVFGKNYLNFD
jgi:hypothetical protein